MAAFDVTLTGDATFLDFLNFMEEILANGTIEPGETGTSFTLVGTFAGEPISMTVTGTGFTYEDVNGQQRFTAGSMTSASLVFDGNPAGTIALSAGVNTHIDLSLLRTAFNAEAGGNDAAIESFLLGIGWTYTANGNTPEFVNGLFGEGVPLELNGNDHLTFGGGPDVVFAGGGDDFIAGGIAIDPDSGSDFLSGGGGNDVIHINHGTASGDAGDDRIMGIPGDPSQTYFVGAVYTGATTGIVANLTASIRGGLAGGNVNDGFLVLDGLGGTDRISDLHRVQDSGHNDQFWIDASWTNSYGNWVEIALGAGNDTVVFDGVAIARVAYTSAGGGVRINLGAGTATDMNAANSFIGNDTFTGATQARGSNFSDEIYGHSGNDQRLRGHNGNDFISGQGGDDLIEGEGDNDTLVGGAGNDTIDGGEGWDLAMFSGNRTDYRFTANQNGTVTVVDLRGGSPDGTDTLRNVEVAVFANGSAPIDLLSQPNVIVGTDQANNPLNGTSAERETIFGLAGNDRIFGGAGEDWISGGQGNDYIDAGSGTLDDANFVWDAMDYMADVRQGGGQGVSVNLATGIAIDPFGNTDTLIEIERIYATNFGDLLIGSADADAFDPHGGADIIDGGAGHDELMYHLSFEQGGNGAIIVTLNDSTAAIGDGTVIDPFGQTDTFYNIEQFRGTRFNDTFNGGQGDQFFSALQGNDTIDGGAGFDMALYHQDIRYGGMNGITVDLGIVDGQGYGSVVDAFGSTDRLRNIEGIRGTGFNDTIRGNGVANTLIGDAGNDLLDGRGGADLMRGGTGNDTYYVDDLGDDVDETGADGTDLVWSSISWNLADTSANFGSIEWLALSGTANLNGTGNGLDNLIIGNSGNNILSGGNGNDILEGNLGTDVLDGQAGSDTASYSSSAAAITARLDLGFGVGSDGLFDTFVSIENVLGSAFGDVIAGAGGVANRLDGGAGDDIIYGEGIDTVIGGAGNDTFFGGAGGALNIDLGAAGLETVWGSYFSDNLDGTSQTLNLTLIGQGPTADTMRGGAGADFIYFRAGDTISGGGGNDWAVASLSLSAVTLDMTATGFESAWGSSASDTISALGSSANLTIVGDTGNDTLIGGNGADFLYGFGDNDFLTGSAGNDSLIGGAGADHFIYNTATWGTDFIYDFVTGTDRIDMRGSGVTNFGQLTETEQSGLHTVYTFGSSQIWVLNNTTVGAGDFIFV